MLKIKFLPLLFLISVLHSCVSYEPYGDQVIDSPNESESDLAYSILFYSGSDEKSEITKVGFDAIKKDLTTTDALVSLGNITPKHGMPDSVVNSKRSRAETILQPDIDLLNSFSGRKFVLRGLNEWGGGRTHGYDRVLDFEEYLNTMTNDSLVIPQKGCSGPVELELNEGLVMIFFDTQWYLHAHDKPDPTQCGWEDESSYLVAIEDAIRRNENKKVLMVGYHPIFSNGEHGGYLSAKYHFLPPVLGSIYAWYKSRIGGPQDLKDFRYRGMRRYLRKLLETHPHAMYLSSHEMAMQHFENENVNYFTAGSLSGTVKVADGEGESFAQGTQGYGRLNFYENGDVFVEFTSTSSGKATLVYRKKLFNHQYNAELDDEDAYKDLSYEGQVKSAVATTILDKEGKKPGLLGNNYRKEWSMEMKDVRVFDLGKEKGGLKIVKKGGGLQTKSLRLEAADGKQYGLRSIEKFPDKAVPQALRGTVIGGLVTDQVSASHPYGAFVVPKLAEAAGVYHTNPELVYLPNDPRLGKYREDFGDGLYLFEERPAGKAWKESDFFGNPDEIVSTFDLIEKIQKNDKHQIDEDHVLRSRLFDILIGDWDRHEDQWRWAKYELEDGKKLYRPIPRDRDQAFFWSDGTIIALASHKWGYPKFQGFHDEIRDVEGLEFNARFFDRTFLIQKNLDDWLKMAEEIKSAVTDEVIEEAIRDWPDEIYDVNGETIINKLKRRRDDLSIYAKQFYSFLAEEVEVVGSKKAELFVVNRLSDEETEVSVYRVKEKSGKEKFKWYNRVFKASETKEIRLYGLGDDDRFTVSGDVKKGTKIKIIGGKGDDMITDDSKVSGGGKKTIVYDTKAGTSITSGNGEVKNKTSDTKENINEYDRRAFQYDKLIPAVAFEFNPDDGLFFGGGFTILKHGFRKSPFKSKHNATISVAPRSGSYHFQYTGTFAQVVGKWDAKFQFDVLEPSYGDFFYGFGNKTAEIDDLIDEDRQFYNVRYSQWIFQPSLTRSINKIHDIKVGGYARRVNLTEGLNDEEPNRFITQYEDIVGVGGDGFSLFDNVRNYVGLNFEYQLNHVDLNGAPSKGIRWNVSAKAINQIDDEENNYQSLNSDISTYLTFVRSGSFQTTLALRVGGGANFGDFEFFQAQRLGGVSHVRGFAKNRFTGDEKLYSNAELRFKLLDIRTPVFPLSFGVHGLYDIGRVWTSQEDTPFRDDTINDWHMGYGGGIWLAPFLGQIVISSDFALNNEDDSAFYVRMGFLF